MDNESVTVENDKKVWSPPVVEVIDIEETAGLGGGGPDFGSELS
jgi:hypothetical protein